MAVERVVPRPSASVILIRDTVDGLETFMVRRHPRSPVAPSAYVFPGGTVRDDDSHLHVDAPDLLAKHLTSRSDTAVAPEKAAALYLCAVRELFEEAGVLFAHDSEGRLVTVDPVNQALQERLATTRLGLQAHEQSLVTVFAEWGWQPACDLLIPFSHWVTPAVLAARFDTWFFVAAMPPGQAALHDTIETTAGAWLRPPAVLEGDYHTVYATAQHLRRLSPFSTVADLLAYSAAKRIVRIEPRLVESDSGLRVSIAPDLLDAW